MSKNIAKIPIIGDVASMGTKLVGGLFKTPKMPDAAPLPERGAPPSDPAVAKRATEQLANREQALQRQAVAAGALRSENDADVLGFSGPKKRAASRSLLGQ